MEFCLLASLEGEKEKTDRDRLAFPRDRPTSFMGRREGGEKNEGTD